MARLDRQIDPVVLGGPLKYTLNDLAELTESPVEYLEMIMRSIGQPVRNITEKKWTDDDVKTILEIKKFKETEEISDTDLSAMLQGLGATMERLALRHVEAIVQHLAAELEISDTSARLKAASFAPAKAGPMFPIMEQVWKRHYAEAIHRLTTEAVAQRGVQSDDIGFPLVRVVGFADLVNFTARTEEFSTGQFSELVHNFHNATWDIIMSGGGRVINWIGDAVFWVANDIYAGADIALALAKPGALGICGEARVGLAWSRVMSAYGDFFGPGVNLAARLTDAAPPNEVFVGPAAAVLLARAPEYMVEEQPEFEAKGIGVVHPARLRYADDPRNDG